MSRRFFESASRKPDRSFTIIVCIFIVSVFFFLLARLVLAPYNAQIAAERAALDTQNAALQNEIEELQNELTALQDKDRVLEMLGSQVHDNKDNIDVADADRPFNESE